MKRTTRTVVALGILGATTLGVAGVAGASAASGTSATFSHDGGRGGPFGPEGFGRHGGAHRGDGSTVVEETLGMTREEIRDGLQDGKSLADLATAKGVPVSKLIDALVAEARTRITEMVNTAPKMRGSRSTTQSSTRSSTQSSTQSSIRPSVTGLRYVGA